MSLAIIRDASLVMGRGQQTTDDLRRGCKILDTSRRFDLALFFLDTIQSSVMYEAHAVPIQSKTFTACFPWSDDINRIMYKTADGLY